MFFTINPYSGNLKEVPNQEPRIGCEMLSPIPFIMEGRLGCSDADQLPGPWKNDLGVQGFGFRV